MTLARAASAAFLLLALAGLGGGCDPSPMGSSDASPDARRAPPAGDAGPDARDEPPPLPDGGRDGGGGLYEDICGPMPQGCEARLCITSIRHPSFEDCCDSTFCNCDPVDHHWETIACDPPPPPDAGAP